MGLILPQYLLHEKRFKCQKCGFAFVKRTPSRVEKCPMCKQISYERGVKPGDTLDPYSRSKERWYKNEEQHLEEIRHREIRFINGKKETVQLDNRGRLVEVLPDIPT